jgi:rhodanese-related sulfurtransferase
MIRFLSLLLLLMGSAAQAYEEVTSDMLWSWMAWPNAPVVVDVRELSEWQSGHIAQAMHYAWLSGDLKTRWRELSQAHSIVVVCQSGKRAAAASSWLETLRDSGFSAKIYRLTDGMDGWNHSITGIASRRKVDKATARPSNWDLLGRLRRGTSFGTRLR